MELSDLPGLSATLIGVAPVLLATGSILIRHGRRNLHRGCMRAAFGTSTLFLVSYLDYHANVGSVAFTGQGAV